MAIEQMKLWKLLSKDGPFEEDDLEEIRKHLPELGAYNMNSYYYAHIRTSLETMLYLTRLRRSIERFDQTSSILGKRVFWLTIAATFFGFVQAGAAVISLIHMK